MGRLLDDQFWQVSPGWVVFLLQNFTCPHCAKGFIEELEIGLENPDGALNDVESDDELEVGVDAWRGIHVCLWKGTFVDVRRDY